jgi:hypothetical protein
VVSAERPWRRTFFYNYPYLPTDRAGHRIFSIITPTYQSIGNGVELAAINLSRHLEKELTVKFRLGWKIVEQSRPQGKSVCFKYNRASGCDRPRKAGGCDDGRGGVFAHVCNFEDRQGKPCFQQHCRETWRHWGNRNNIAEAVCALRWTIVKE